VTDDQHGEGTPPRSAGRWDPLPQGDYDDGATAFVKLPEGGIDALLAANSPLAAPGQGYVPPPITATPQEGGPAPAVGDAWSVPQGGAEWPDPNAVPQGGRDDRFTYNPASTQQWDFGGTGGTETGQTPVPAAGQHVTGQWSIPVADGDIPDESGEFTASSLVEQWGGTPPATLPGGAAAPWATQQPAAPAWGQDTPADGVAATAYTGDPANPMGSDGRGWPAAPSGTDGQGFQPDGGPTDGQGYPVAGDGTDGRGYPADPYGSDGRGYPVDRPETDGRGYPASGDGTDGRGYPAPAAPSAHETPAPASPVDHPAPGEPAHGHEAAVREAGTPEAAADAQRVAEAADGPAGSTEEPAAGAPAASGAAEAAEAAGAAASGAATDTAPREDTESGEPPALPQDEHPLASYTLSVNGADRPVSDAWIGESLLYVLRERLGLAGAKDGCSEGECGACNVQVDGRLVASCLVPAVTAAGSEVRTVEGLAVDGQPSDVQRALAECGAVQCGFCVPGMAMTLHDLLEGNPAPTELETRQALSGNLCRCSGYRGVLDAVKVVVSERETHAAAEVAETEGTEARIPHQAGPGAGGVHHSVFDTPGFETQGQAPQEQPQDQSHEQSHDEAQPYDQPHYEQQPYDQQPYEQSQYEQQLYDQAEYDQARYDQQPYDRSQGQDGGQA
jgi:aerobic-type carbon monoxide dehydrogenase small subunit (CoxS/CutS family)